MLIQVKKLNDDAIIPKYKTEGSSGFDLASVENWMIAPKQTQIIMTGLSFAIPAGFEMQVRPRSGLTAKTKLRVHLGTIDSDYRGEVGIIAENVGDDYIRVSQGDRIAQGVISPIKQASFQLVDDLEVTARGLGGFGSTGLSELIKQVIK